MYLEPTILPSALLLSGSVIWDKVIGIIFSSMLFVPMIFGSNGTPYEQELRGVKSQVQSCMDMWIVFMD